MRSQPATLVHRFQQVDVFTDTALRGNPVAVVLDADGLDAPTMQAMAAWTNLSETTFLLQPTAPRADYRARIFTPNGELPFAGHPTLGSAHAWLTSGGVPREAGVVRQECEVGVIPVRTDGERLAFAAPPVAIEPVGEAEVEAVVAALGLDPALVEDARYVANGPRWLVLLVSDASAVLALEPDHTALRSLPKVGVVGHMPDGAECRIEVRAFADSIGVPEDPVTGSLNAGVGQWLIADGRLPPSYIVSQGVRLGRSGRIHVDAADGEVWVGGGTRTLIVGELHL